MNNCFEIQKRHFPLFSKCRIEISSNSEGVAKMTENVYIESKYTLFS